MSILSGITDRSPINLLKYKDIEVYENYICKEEENYVHVLATLSDAESISIPKYINNKPVKTIGFNGDILFSDFANTIILPDTVTVIESNAFCCDDNVKSVIAPCVNHVCTEAFSNSSIEHFSSKGKIIIDYKAFEQCHNLYDVSIPNAIMIAEFAFAHCINLEKIEINRSLRRLEEYAFAYCHRLSEVSIKSSIDELEDYSFMDCTNLKAVRLKKRNTSVSNDTFKNCYKLNGISYFQ